MKTTPKKTTMPLNIRQERFAELVAGGMPAMQAYVKAGYSSKGRNAEGNASALMGNHGVKAYIKVLRERSANKLEMKRENLARHLYLAAMTPVGEIDEKSPLSSEFTVDTIAGGTRGKLRKGNAASGNEETNAPVLRKRVKSMDKIGAARLLCEMMGWKEPEQVVIESGPKTLEAVRERAKLMASPLSRIP